MIVIVGSGAESDFASDSSNSEILLDSSPQDEGRITRLASSKFSSLYPHEYELDLMGSKYGI